MECAKFYGVEERRGIVIIRPFDKTPIVYDGTTYVSDMTKWLNLHANPVLFEFAEKTFTPIFREHNAALMFISMGDHEAKAKFEEAAKALHGEILFTWTDLSTEFAEEIVGLVGLKVPLPAIVLLNPKGNDVFKYIYR